MIPFVRCLSIFDSTRTSRVKPGLFSVSHYKSKYLQESERERENYILKLLNYRYTYVDGTNCLPLRRKCVLAFDHL